MQNRKEKVCAQAAHLLDVYRALKARYALLAPLLFDKGLVARVGQGRRAHGLNVLRIALLETCVLGIAKILHDGDKRAANVKALIESLTDHNLYHDLRESFAVWHVLPESVDDPDVLVMIQESERREEERRREQFDTLVTLLRTQAEALDGSEAIKGFRTMRDQLIAHNQLSFDGTSHTPLDITTLGLKLGDVGDAIVALEQAMDSLTLVFRNASYDFAEMQAQVERDMETFWSPLA